MLRSDVWPEGAENPRITGVIARKKIIIKKRSSQESALKANSKCKKKRITPSNMRYEESNKIRMTEKKKKEKKGTSEV